MTLRPKQRAMLGISFAMWAYLLIPVWAQSTHPKVKPLAISDALDVRYFSEYAPIDFSPDGAWIAFAARANKRNHDISPEELENTGVPHFGSASEIYLQDRRTGTVRKLTEGSDNWLPTWSPNGQHLAFMSNRGGTGEARLWIWDKSNNSLYCASQVGTRGAQIAWVDNDSVAVAARPTEERAATPPGGGDANARPAGVQDSSAIGVREFRTIENSGKQQSVGPWDLDRFRRALILVDIHGSHPPTTLVRSTRISSFYLSPDRRRIAYSSPLRFESPNSQQMLFDINSITLGSSAIKTIFHSVRMDISGREFRWSVDGSWIAFQASGMSEEHYDAFVANSTTGAMRNVTQFRQVGHSGGSPLWDREDHLYILREGELWRAATDNTAAVRISRKDSVKIKQMVSDGNQLFETDRSAFVLGQDNVTLSEHLYRVDLRSGMLTELGGSEGCLDCAVMRDSVWVSPERTSLAVVRETGSLPPDLWEYDLSRAVRTRLTTLNPTLEPYAFGNTRIVRWLSDDGVELGGTLLLPSGYVEGQRYPLVVWVYGTASGKNHLNSFGTAATGPLNMQLLATRGFAILFPDAPQNQGSPMLDLVKTVLPGVNKVVEMGVADKNRIGVMGHSNGGITTMDLLVQTRRFAAAVVIDGTSDLLGFYGEMDKKGASFGLPLDEQGLGLMGGTPWEFRDRYIENSPFFYLDRVSTPLLIVEGGADTFVQPYLTNELFVAMKRLGKTAEYATYEGEGHGPEVWNYKNQQDLAARVIGWFEHYLTPKVYVSHNNTR